MRETKQISEQGPDRAGIQVSANEHTILVLDGMTCASCAMRIEKGLKKLSGITEASVNFATEQATVTYDPAQTGLEQMVEKVETLGYTASPVVQQQPSNGVSSVSDAVRGAVQEAERNQGKSISCWH